MIHLEFGLVTIDNTVLLLLLLLLFLPAPFSLDIPVHWLIESQEERVGGIGSRV